MSHTRPNNTGNTYNPVLLIIDPQNDFCPSHYDVVLVSNEKELKELKPENKKLHVAIAGNSLLYKSMYPEGVIHEGVITTHDLPPNSSINQKSIKKLSPAILRIAAGNAHIPGALAVKEGDRVMPKINKLMLFFKNLKAYIAATKDYHPKNHMSFASNNPGSKPYDTDKNDNVLWPNHCVQGSHGAEFHAELRSDLIDDVVEKGTDPSVDSYSGFLDNDHKTKTPLDDKLKQKEITHVFVAGLATDYCVKFSVLDAIQFKYKEVYCIQDACRGVDLKKGDVEAALKKMEAAGAHVIQSAWVPMIDIVNREAAVTTDVTSSIVAKLKACDQAITALQSTINTLFGNLENIGEATAAHIALLTPLLQAWKSVLHAPDNKKYWDDFINECNNAIERAKSDLFSPKGMFNRLFAKGPQTSLTNKVEQIAESAKELTKFVTKTSVKHQGLV